MIEWLDLHVFEDRLKRTGPIGLKLRPFVQATCAGDPRPAIGYPSSADSDLPNVVHSWTGFVGELPFAIQACLSPYGRWGLEIWFPDPVSGDHALLAALRELPLPGVTGLLFEALPVRGGFAVVERESDAAIYASASRRDALAFAELAESFTHTKYEVTACGPSRPAWLVVGPVVGDFLSRLEVAGSEAAARTTAARWTAETGVDFWVTSYLDRA